MHERMNKVNEILEKDLKDKMDKIVRAGTITPEDIKILDCAVDLMLDFKNYEAWDNGENSFNSYGDGYSTRRGRSSVTGRYVSMDPMPMMPSDGYSGRRFYRGSYDHGYSGHNIKDRMIDRLESMYDEVQTEHERQMVDEWINRLESSK